MKSYDHHPGNGVLLGRTLGDHFDHMVALRPAHEALVDCHQRICLSYADLQTQVDLFARGLMKLGIGPSDRVGIWSTNNVEWVITQLATAKIGAILVNINPAYRTGELEYALRQSGVKLLVLISGYKGDEYLSMLHELAPEIMCPDMDNPIPRLPELQHLVLIGNASESQSPQMLTFAGVSASGYELPACELAHRAAQLQFDDSINIQYTSGTTGFPKGVTLSHHNLLNNSLYAGYAMGLNDTSRFCVPMPFYHCGGMVLCTLATLNHGGTLVIPSGTFDSGAVLAAIERQRCTHIAGVPTMYVSELEHHHFHDFDLSSLVGGFMAGAPCPVQLMHSVAKEMHLKHLIIIYGQTECSPIITSTLAGDSLEVRATTVGKVIPHLEVKIVDPLNGQAVPRGSQGEICARGYATMLGYWNNPSATAEAIDQAGWLHTGDLGTMSGDGYLNITGRKKDMIIRGGENVYPREIEEVLHGYPVVSQAHVFGVPDDYFGEEVVVWVKLKAGTQCSEDEIRSWLKEKVAFFKVPRYVKFVSEFPMTVTGKIQKYLMRQEMIAELGLEAVAKIQTA